MNTTGVLAFGALSLMITAAASAQTRHIQSESRSTPPAQTLEAPSGQNPPIFIIGHLPVYIWAPVEAPNDAHMNRNGAANPIWESDTGYPGF